MGEAQAFFFEPSFNRAVKVRATDDRLTSDAGALLLREADNKLGLTESLAAKLIDPRNPEKIRYDLVELVRERLYGMANGYSTQDDADRLAHDPAFKLAVWDRPGENVINERLASQPTQSRLIDTLARPTNLAALRESLADWSHRHLKAVGGDRPAQYVTIDIDSFPLVATGDQEGAKYNGYYCEKIFHPLVASYCVAGDYDATREGFRLGNGFVHATLRAGNVHTAEGIKRFLLETIRKTKSFAEAVDIRIDAGLVEGPVLDMLTREKVRFIGRIKSNAILERMADPHVSRPPGRPPQGGYEYTVELGMYQAASWKHSQRIVLVVVDRPDKNGQLNLSPDYFFLVVGWKQAELSADESLAHYRKRGTFEDRLGEFNQAIGAKLPSQKFRENEATLLLALLAFNMANMLRIEMETTAGSCWDLGRFQRDVLKAGGSVVKHSRRLVLNLAKAIVPLWEVMKTCIAAWRFPASFAAPCGAYSHAWTPLPRHAFREDTRRG